MNMENKIIRAGKKYSIYKSKSDKTKRSQVHITTVHQTKCGHKF